MTEQRDERFNNDDLYDKYSVTIKVRDKLCGGVPKNHELIESWVKARTAHDDRMTKTQTAEVIETVLEEKTESAWTGFQCDPEHGLFLATRNVKAMLRESATMLRLFVKKRGSKQIVQHGFEIKGGWHHSDGRVYLCQDEPDGADEGAIHVMTAQGPRTAIKKVDYVSQCEIKFQIWVFKTAAQEKRHLGEADVIEMLTFAQENGLGAQRSQGYGKFDVTGFESM
jgi:hypothetical protein